MSQHRKVAFAPSVRVFAVREFDASTQVCVYEGEVELQPLLGLGSPHLFAGEYAHFNRRSVASIEKNQTHDALWLEQKNTSSGHTTD
ncbi:hypothetical protein QW180_29525 [Vibrio sinaloensis]|nr:hypothetical protein [Vibrio sinaloensis]